MSFNPQQQPGGNHHLATMFARLQAARIAQGHLNDDDSDNDAPSQFSSNYNHGDNSSARYGAESAADTPDLFPPPAPTPPSGPNFNRSYQPPGMSNLGPIGSSMPSSSNSKAEQSNSLLNLLKFSGAGGQQSQQASSQAGSLGSHGSRHGSFHGSQQASPATSQHPPAPAFDRNLLNSPNPTIHAPVPKPVDPQGLLATLMKGNHAAHHEQSMQDHSAQQHQHHQQQHQQQQQQSQSQSQSHQNNWNAGAPPADTQAYLLNLLNRPKPAQHDQTSTNESSQPATLTPPSTNESAVDPSRDYGHHGHMSGSQNAHSDSTPNAYNYSNEYAPSPPAHAEHQHPIAQTAKFDYANPFDDFAAASPHNRTPKSSTPGTSTTYTEQVSHNGGHVPYTILRKAPSAGSSPGAARDLKRSGYAPESDYAHHHEHGREEHAHEVKSAGSGSHEDPHRETVSEAMSDLAGKADQEAQEALARASQEEAHSHLAEELEDLMNAKTDAEFQEKAEAAAKDLQQELSRPENRDLLEKTYSPGTAETIRGLVDDAAHGGVADSWESAEAEDIVVIEEEAEPVKVYNFPMKPWISITMLENKEPRPEFRDDVVLDIARLKKDFDQIDRNLVCATESYMVYGMSKAGGLRVIRQEDGKDAKLFTDTKDRIFNVSVSSTPSDVDTTPKESIIGTGISGTIYYVQIKNGDKDHLEDPHPEQYGFALPPVTNNQEGDAPGGVLKTRARISSSHPEFFAVGRGKTINIIWPSYIMQNNLFKPGHDRVVDTELLTKQCALKINTGKAGKDFTFSQDDTTIVSLDKSGRVKFWDVRDLTAAQENADSRSPMPAHTSLEVKEPLMTLNTTPEGEKAWPTSVLLLDKQRPYQKRCALRYMIVGMKQNHTLQLWDLALGKPVQEFNLPHSKESDAVCSVMYHPPTGMIVVGHPTRNSIYFLHLSAPKYTIKGLSQVDYIQKLVAKDSSIPEPDSTAVISGVREYSFANKGILRSLDILVNPAVSSDGDEQTLFELYAMHSKGVTGIWVKQPELGWTKDNKVIAGVDATEAGLVKIAKLKELPSSVVASEPAPAEDALPIRIVNRAAKDNVTPTGTAAPDTSSRKAAEPLAPAVKENEPPATPNEKGEKKTRKKRDKAAAAAAAAAAADKGLAETNGTSASNSNVPAAPKLDAKLSSANMSPESVQAAVSQIVANLSTSVSQIVASEMKDHRASLEQDITARESNFMKKQKELLELVSSVLNDNVQTVLTKLINDQFEESVVPQLGPLIAKTVAEQLDSKIGGKVSHSVQNQMQKLLPTAVSQALQKPELSKAISDKLVGKVAMNMEESFQQTLMNTITPVFSDMAVAASRSLIHDVKMQTSAQINALEERHIADNKKIDQLTALVTRLSDTVTAMASTQAQFQDSFLKMQEQMSQRIPSGPTAQPAPSQYSQGYDSPASNSNNRAMVPYPNKAQSNKDHELQTLISNIATYMEAGDYETALVRWLQGDRKHEVFDQYLVKYNANFLQELPALVLLSVGSVLSEELDGAHIREKVAWLEMILHNLHASLPHIDSQVREVVPNIMGQFVSRLEHMYMQISSRAPTDNILKHISTMVNMANRLRDAARHPGY